MPPRKMGGVLSYEQLFNTRTNTEQYGEHIYGFPKRSGAWCVGLLKQNLLTETNLRRYFLSNAQTSWGGGISHLRISNAGRTMVQQPTQNQCPQQYTDSHTQALWGDGAENSKIQQSRIYGFAGNIQMGRAQWCTGLKRDVIRKVFSSSPKTTGGINIVQYLGIASDEPERIARHEKKKGIMLPLVMANWDEAYCRKWCEERDLLSPIYTTATRGGCWFCHNQGVGQLRLLRKNYPELWGILMRLDLDSPTTFKADGHTVHDYDKRFELEDKGIISADEPFKWKYLDTPPTKQITLFDFMENDNEKQGN